jgi:hypothetical protein
MSNDNNYNYAPESASMDLAGANPEPFNQAPQWQWQTSQDMLESEQHLRAVIRAAKKDLKGGG